MVEIDRVEHTVKKGSVVFIPGDAEHGVRNTSETEEFIWLYVFAVDEFGEVVYRFRDEREADGGTQEAVNQLDS